jgi:hypothetical protein
MLPIIKRAKKSPPRRVSTAEAFYRVFCALPRKDRLAVARYILEDEDIRQQLEIPNELTRQAFAEAPEAMPVFQTIDALRKDLLL